MKYTSLLLAFASLIVLVGCGTSKPKPEPVPRYIEARHEMIGMTKQEIGECLGQPKKIQLQPPSEVWSFAFNQCTVTLTIHGRVTEAVIDEVPWDPKSDNPPPTIEDACDHVPEVGGCLRWLRTPYHPSVFPQPKAVH